MARDASRLAAEVSVSFQDCKFDAKINTSAHPWASGSFNSIADCVPFNAFVKNRMHSLNPVFRDNTLWIFAQEDRKLKMQLHAQAMQQNTTNSSALKVFAETKTHSGQFAKRCSSQVAEKGAKRQRACYDMTLALTCPSRLSTRMRISGRDDRTYSR